MSLYTLPVRRPVATSMFFAAVFVLGWFAWQRIPVELLPRVSGDSLYVTFSRPGSEPEVVEREILLPLESRAAQLSGVEETWAELRGSGGTFHIRFEQGAQLEVREIELRRLAAELIRDQPRGTTIDVQSQDTSAISRFVMIVQVTGMDDRASLVDFVDEHIVPRLAAVPGTARVLALGAATREVGVRIDPERCAALGVKPEEVISVLDRSVRRVRFVGGVEDEAGRTSVMLDGRPRGLISLADLVVAPGRQVRLRHVAEVQLGTGRQDMLFRVNGHPTVGLILFQEEGVNLVRLGADLRQRFAELRAEFREYGLNFVVNFDAAKLVEDQLDRLEHLAATGFAIALVVLYLFLRQWRAVGVVAVAVPASLLSALALLYLAGQSLNLITLFGLAVGIGMLVDNSIVVYEAVQRQLERGASPDAAAERGVRRTLRAILGSIAANSIVFLPILFTDFESAPTRSMLQIMALAILLPLAASVLVAVGLVPLLARRLTAPAAVARLAGLRRRREETGGLSRPDRIKELFTGLLAMALRRPAAWVTAVVAAVLFTVIVALPWIAFGAANREPAEADDVRFAVEFEANGSLDRAAGAFERMEGAALGLDGVEYVESMVREEGGSLTVHLKPKDLRPKELNAGRVREVVRAAQKELPNIRLRTSDSATGGGGDEDDGGGMGALLGQAPAATVLSGPDARVLDSLARDIEEQLRSISEVESAAVQGSVGQPEVRVTPDESVLAALGLTADEVMPALLVVRREGVTLRTGFIESDGREIPMTVRREGDERRRGTEDLRQLRVSTSAGVVPFGALFAVHRMPAPPPIRHHDGRREVRVTYRLGAQAPATGPARQALEDQIRRAIQQVHRPPGYTIDAPEADESFDWFKRILLPVVLLLFAVLAFTFESLTLPLLVLVALPLTVLGATWALVLSGMPADYMALVGTLTLIGITVNPAILLVDRMQQRAWGGGMSAGAAALAAVRERARPVLMTMTTAVAGLWPMALVTGRENEIWPPFATVMMGGLITSTLLTLLFIPVGFVFLHRLDRLFGRLGPWIVIGWWGATALVVTPLFLGGVVGSMTWRILTTMLVASALLGLAVWLFRRTEFPEPVSAAGPPVVEVRCLHKIYGRPGPVGRAWRVHERFAVTVRRLGGQAFDTRDAGGRVVALVLVLGGALYLVSSVATAFWRVIFAFVCAVLVSAALRQFRAWRGKTDDLGRVLPGGPENLAAACAPWVAFVWIVLRSFVMIPAGQSPEIRWWILTALGLVVFAVQFGRRTAQALSRGTLGERPVSGPLRRPRGLWRRFSRACFGLDLPREEVRALSGVGFRAERGMIGILGPNGAGKTTLLRLLAGILDPSTGVVLLGERRVFRLRRYLARWVGYLPQDFGLPRDLTAREYLDYWALLYEIGPTAERRERVGRLLEEVGLAARADEKIGSFSGGMRQRVAVARTLLRLPQVIIVDEPTVGLDPRERIRFRNLLSRLAEGRVVLFSTHVVEDVEVACERVVVMARGRVVFDGPPPALADVAEGKVWAIVAPPGAAPALPPGAFVVEQIPEASGALRTRVLSAERPGSAAESTAPTLQDGYLWLVAERREAA